MLKKICDVIRASYDKFWDDITPEDIQKSMETQP